MHCQPDSASIGGGDQIACVENSVCPFYRHAALMMTDRPKIEPGKLEAIQPGSAQVKQ